MRVLVVMNFAPDEATPQRGRWVVDQVDALRAGGIDVDLFTFPPGKDQYLPATREIRRLIRDNEYDLVHAHYGLAGWCARLAGARPLIVTFHGTDVRHPVVGRMSRRLTKSIDLTGAAILIGPGDEAVAVINGSFSFVTDTPDFWRREHANYPSHGDRFTGEPAYFKHVTGAAERLPADARFVLIPGGNHTQFGSYGQGLQRGDNPATISREEQQSQIVDATVELLATISAG